MYRKISQVDARRFRLERDEAREALRNFIKRGGMYFVGTEIVRASITNFDVERAKLRTARLLEYTLFVTIDNDGQFVFRAVKP